MKIGLHSQFYPWLGEFNVKLHLIYLFIYSSRLCMVLVYHQCLYIMCIFKIDKHGSVIRTWCNQQWLVMHRNWCETFITLFEQFWHLMATKYIYVLNIFRFRGFQPNIIRLYWNVCQLFCIWWWFLFFPSHFISLPGGQLSSRLLIWF